MASRLRCRDCTFARGELAGLAPRAAFGGRPPNTVGFVGLAPDRYLDTHLDALP